VTNRRYGRTVPHTNPIERRMSKFLREPPSVRTAASVIVVATALVVVGGGVLIRLFDHSEYSNVWVGMWWALQTVTTVAFLAIVTAAITSTFIARAEREREEQDTLAEADDRAWAAGRFDELAERLDRLESMLRASD